MSRSSARADRPRVAFVVSHPIQYYAPLHQALAAGGELEVKVFFTWHAGAAAVRDRGFGQAFQWDLPLTEGYEHELVPNVARDPGTHHFGGLQNPQLVERVLAWAPDVAHVTGWAWRSHLAALWCFRRKGLPTLFRGDSHLLDERRSGPRWAAKQAVLRTVFSWPEGFLVTGSANRAYYRAFRIEETRLFDCRHSIDVSRFAEPEAGYEAAARAWRRELGVADDQTVVLFAGKFEPKKQPLELMRAMQELDDPSAVLVMLGGGELQAQVDLLAAAHPARFRVLPFQNQSRMPVAYRLADLFVLPSAYGETWGLAINEALACGRPVLASDHVGCARDVVDEDCGRIFAIAAPSGLKDALADLLRDRPRLGWMRAAAMRRSWMFDIGQTRDELVRAVGAIGR